MDNMTTPAEVPTTASGQLQQQLLDKADALNVHMSDEQHVVIGNIIEVVQELATTAVRIDKGQETLTKLMQSISDKFDSQAKDSVQAVEKGIGAFVMKIAKDKVTWVVLAALAHALWTTPIGKKIDEAAPGLRQTTTKAIDGEITNTAAVKP